MRWLAKRGLEIVVPGVALLVLVNVLLHLTGAM